MKLLGLDTATMTASAAVIIDGAVAAAEDIHTGHGATSEGLMPLIARVLERAGVAPRDLDAVAVGAGPGSFTGLRIGMATAKGIAFAAGIPLWAVSSLAALALGAVRRGATGTIIPVLDARRGELYAGFYRDDLTALAPDAVLTADALRERSVSYTDRAVVGHEVDGFGTHMAVPRTPGAVEVALLALRGERVDVLVGGAPVYIRPSEAEVMYPDGVPGARRKQP